MGKIITVSLLAGWLASTSAFGQGYLHFEAALRTVYDGFTTPGVSATAATVNTTFLWAPANTVPTVGGFMASVPTNTTNDTIESFGRSQAWSAILNGQFNLAVNNDTGTLVTQLTTTKGAVAYLGGVQFPLAGTTGGLTYTLYMIGWDANYATPALAAAAYGGAGAAVGWSVPFQITLGLSAIDVNAPDFPGASSTAAQFGTISTIVATAPEPASTTLALLGGLSLLALRRNKK